MKSMLKHFNPNQLGKLGGIATFCDMANLQTPIVDRTFGQWDPGAECHNVFCCYTIDWVLWRIDPMIYYAVYNILDQERIAAWNKLETEVRRSILG